MCLAAPDVHLLALQSLTSGATNEYTPTEEELKGSSQDAFYKVTVLEEELRVMQPDLGAIQAYM